MPAYAIFTNEQLATFVRERITTKSGMESVAGVGAAKIKSYADVFLPVLLKFFPHTGERWHASNEEKSN